MKMKKHLVFNSTLLFVMLIESIGVSGKDLSENERAGRAAFVQRLLNKKKYLEGRVKLVGGNKYEGNVYIYHAGRWGAICDDSWDDAAAQVVCRVFNRTGFATHGGQYGEAKEKFWMDDVVCQGDESSLTQCTFSGWGSSDCTPTEAAGVKCRKQETHVPLNLSTKKKAGAPLHEVLDIRYTSLRLVGGRNALEGRVEIYHNNYWGSLCPDGWTIYEAAATCRHLGLGYAEQALQTDYFGSSKIVLSGVECQGNETNLLMCRHQKYGNVTCPGTVGHVAAVICTQKLADLELDTAAIEHTAHLQDVPMYQLTCAMEENCLTKSAYETQKTNPNWQYETRRLLRFTAASLNIGNDEFRPYLPKHLWQWHLCHMHYHSMEVFATFDVFDASGRRVAEGHKASFCLEDNTCMPGVEKKYSCKNYGDQGVSVNCSDVYHYNIDCQWVDVSDVEPGDYTLKVAVNPHARIAEQNYHNNAASCRLRLSELYAAVYGCKRERP